VHCAVSRHRARLRIFAIGRNHIGDIHCHRSWHERALSAFKRSTCLAAISAKARRLDGACEAIHGLPAARDAALSSLRARRPARSGGSDLGKLFPVDDQRGLLDERRVRFANSISDETRHRARAHARHRGRERHLFHRRQISFH